ncbi:MAG: putative transposase [Glaciecola sp.]|jgi:putative transposase
MSSNSAHQLSLNLSEDAIFFYKDNHYIVDHVSTKRARHEYLCLRIDNQSGDIIDSNIIHRLCVAELTAALHSGNAYLVKKDDFDSKNRLNNSDKELLKFQGWQKFFDVLCKRTGNRYSTAPKYLNLAIKSVNWGDYELGTPGLSTAQAKVKRVRDNEGDVYVLLPKKYRKNKGESSLPQAIHSEMMDFIMDNVMVFNAAEKINVAKVYDRFCEYVENLPKAERTKLSKIPCRATFYNHVNQISQVLLAEQRMSAFELKKFKRKQTTEFIIKRVLERVEMDAVHISMGIVENVIEKGKEKQIFVGTIILMVAIDVFSRSILGYSYKIGENPSECSDLAVSCFQNTLLPKGQANWPQYGRSFNLVVDQSTTATGNQFQQAVMDAETGFVTTPAGTPWRKPFIERFFNTLRKEFLSEFSSYIGSKRYRNYGGINDDQKVEKLAMLTEQEFVEALDDFIANTYHVSGHAGLGESSPLDVWQDAMSEYGQEIYTFPLDHKVFSRRGKYAPKRTISDKGTVTLDGEKYSSDELKTLQLEGVKTVDVHYCDDDVSSITYSHDNLLYRAYLNPTKEIPEPYEGLQRGTLKALKENYNSHIKKSPKVRYTAPLNTSAKGHRPKGGASEKRDNSKGIDLRRPDAKKTLNNAIKADIDAQGPSESGYTITPQSQGNSTPNSNQPKPNPTLVKKGGKI